MWQWLGDNGEIVVELPREEEDEGQESGSEGGGTGDVAGRGKGKEKAKVHRFTAVSGEPARRWCLSLGW